MSFNGEMVQLRLDKGKKDSERLLLTEGLQPCGVVENENGERGIAFRLGEGLGEAGLSGEVVVFWENGDTTCADGCTIIHNELWNIIRKIESNC